MKITLNNLQEPSNLITFTDIPNILKVEDDGGGTYATMEFTFTGDLLASTTEDGQWYLTFMGDTVSNVISSINAVNKNFLVSSSNISTAASFARALRNCPTVAANFNVIHNDNAVTLRAKAPGVIWSRIQNYMVHNFPSDNFAAVGTDGSSYSDLAGALIDVDIYSEDASGVKYITTLEKNYYGSEAAFNLSPVLTTFAEYERANPYTLKISSLKDGVYTSLGVVDENYISIGYMCNQGLKYLDNSFMNIAQNVSRGETKDTDNNTILYTYAPQIPISFYAGNAGGMTITIDYLDSAYQTLSSSTTTWRNSDSSKKLWDLYIDLTPYSFNRAFYVDIDLGQTYKLRYNVIKPIKATEYYQRILWRNSYGGVSFFDFTGQKTETRDVQIDTYQKNIFDYYTDRKNELEKIYNNDIKYTVTLKSHLFENDGKYIFNDLLQSSSVWTKINGQDYAIIIDSVSVDETDNNNVYEATVKYHYSQEPSLI